MAFSLGEYQDIFLEEADDQLQELNRNLLDMEKNPEDADIINNIFRAAHSLKSSAAFVGLNDLSELAHKMENLLQGVRDKTLRINPEIIDLLFKCFDKINKVIELVSKGERPDVDLSDTIEEIGRVHQQQLKSAPSKTVRDEPVSEAAPKTLFSTQEKKELKKGLDGGLLCYELSIHIEKDAPMKWVKAQLVLNNIKNLTNVIKTVPEEENLTDETIKECVKIVVLTDEDPHELFNACNVDLVNKIDITQITLVRKDDKFVLKYTAVSTDEYVEQSVVTSPEPVVADTPLEKVQTAKETAVFRERVSVPDDETHEEQAHFVERRADKTGSVNAPTLRTVKVPVDKLDDLLNNVGELVIANSGFFRLFEELKKMRVDKTLMNEFKNRMEQMARIAKDLQGGIMKTRMVPIGSVFSRFNRLVRDVSRDCGKDVQLVTQGEDTELDKKVIDVIGEPIMHMIRNSIDHAIEDTSERIAVKKPANGTITLSAHQGGNQIFVEVTDDGRGLDKEKIKQKAITRGLISDETAANLEDNEIYAFIFQPGFSTAEKVTDVSGRGVGMNVVREVVQEMGGNIQIETELGMGTRFIMAFPLTLAIIPAIMINVAREKYAIPLSDVIETINIDKKDITTIEGHEVINLRGEILSLIRLSHFIGILGKIKNEADIPVIVVGYNNRKIGLIVDELEGKLEIVIKSLETNFRTVEGIAGASILGDGTIALILDIASMITMVINEQDKVSAEDKQRQLELNTAEVEEYRQLNNQFIQKTFTAEDVQDISLKEEESFDYFAQADAKDPLVESAVDFEVSGFLVEGVDTPLEDEMHLPEIGEPFFDDEEPIGETPVQSPVNQSQDKTEIDDNNMQYEQVESEDITEMLEPAEDVDVKVREALKQFKSELQENITSVVSSSDTDAHIKKSLAISEQDLSKIKILANVGITKAAESLSMIVKKRIDMSIPNVQLLPVEKISMGLHEQNSVYVGVYMPLVGDVTGNVLFCVPEDSGFMLLNDLYGAESAPDSILGEDGESAIKELTNIIGSSVVNAFSEKTGLSILSDVPVLVRDYMQAILDSMLVAFTTTSNYALTMDCEFYYADDRVVGTLLVLPEINSLRQLVDNLRENE